MSAMDGRRTNRHGIEPDLSRQAQSLLEVLLRLSREPDNHVGGEGGPIELLAQDVRLEQPPIRRKQLLQLAPL